MLIFTSGTGGDPKAVRVMHAMMLLAGAALAGRYELSTDDVCYLSMPLFHSNGVLAGWSVALNSGAAMAPAQFTATRFIDGMFWSGDLAYRDADGWIYLAGRTADWMRVDGENMTAALIERILIRVPAISQVAVYPVPDEYAGDQMMAAIVLQSGATLTPAEFGEFLAAQPDLSPKAWPRHVWVVDELPSTATNKVLKRELVAMGVRPAGRVFWKRGGETHRIVDCAEHGGE